MYTTILSQTMYSTCQVILAETGILYELYNQTRLTDHPFFFFYLTPIHAFNCICNCLYFTNYQNIFSENCSNHVVRKKEQMGSFIFTSFTIWLNCIILLYGYKSWLVFLMPQTHVWLYWILDRRLWVFLTRENFLQNNFINTGGQCLYQNSPNWTTDYTLDWTFITAIHLENKHFYIGKFISSNFNLCDKKIQLHI